jgi:hypothetical protein
LVWLVDWLVGWLFVCAVGLFSCWFVCLFACLFVCLFVCLFSFLLFSFCPFYFLRSELPPEAFLDSGQSAQWVDSVCGSGCLFDWLIVCLVCATGRFSLWLSVLVGFLFISFVHQLPFVCFFV